MEQELLTAEELCKWLKVSRSTVDRWRKAGLPYVKHGRFLRFDRTEILSWLKQNNRQN